MTAAATLVPTAKGGATKADNQPPLITADHLKQDFSYLEDAIAAALKIANGLPPVFEDEEDISAAREAIKDLMKEAKRAEALRVDTKSPYLDAGRVVDSFFGALEKRCADVQTQIEARATRYLDAKAAREKARREEEARIAREAERRRQEEAAAAQRAADEERRKAEAARQAALREEEEGRRAEAERVAAAARADAEEQRRIQEAEEAAQREADEAKRAEAERVAAVARAEAEDRRKAREAEEAERRKADEAKRAESERAAAEARAESDKKDAEARAARQKEIDAAAAANQAQRAVDEKPAEMARTRVGAGLATLAQGFDFEITDLAALDLDALRPHLSRGDLEKAVRQYVKTHKDTLPLRGVRIFPTTSAQFR